MKYVKKELKDKYEPKYARADQERPSRVDRLPEHDKLIQKYEAVYSPKVKFDFKEN